MKGENVFSQLKEGVLVYWNARTAQEQKFLAVGGGVVLLALVYSLFIGPAVDGRANLKKALPALRQEAAQMQAMAAEAQSISRDGVPQVAPMTQESLTASLGARSIKPESITMTGEFAKVHVKDVAFANLVTWLDAQRRESRILVQDMDLSGQGPAGMVGGTLTLRQNTGGGQ
jgi:general secretion pathway protein M